MSGVVAQNANINSNEMGDERKPILLDAKDYYAANSESLQRKTTIRNSEAASSNEELKAECYLGF